MYSASDQNGSAFGVSAAGRAAQQPNLRYIVAVAWLRLVGGRLKCSSTSLPLLRYRHRAHSVSLQLLLSKDPSLPPLIFHLFPWIGSTIDCLCKATHRLYRTLTRYQTRWTHTPSLRRSASRCVRVESLDPTQDEWAAWKRLYLVRWPNQYSATSEATSSILAGRYVTVALTPAGSDLILNGKLAHVSAEDAYTNFTTPYPSFDTSDMC